MRNISFNRFDHRNGIIFDAVFLLRLILAERRREFLKDNVKGNIFLILAALVWGCSLVAQKAGLRYMDPFTFTAIRFLAGGLLMLPLVKAAERRKKERGEEGRQTGEGRRISRAVTIKGALICGTAIASLNILQQYGLEYTTVGKGGFITALYILLTPLLGMLLGKKTGRNTWAGVAIGLAGMYMLCLFGGADRINPGDLLMLCASVACAVHLHAVDHFVGHMDPVKLSCYQFIAAGMISAVISINLGLDDSFRKTHPREIVISAMQDDPAYDDVVGITERAFTEQGLSLEHITDYRDLSFTTVYEEDKDYFSTDTSKYSSGLSMFNAANRLTTLFFVPLEDYNRCMGTDETLSGGEVLVYSSGDPLESGSINVFDSSFKVKKTLDEFMPVSNTLSYLYESHFIVVDDIESLDEIAREQSRVYGDSSSFIAREFMADVSGGSDAHKPQIADAYDDIEQQLEGIEFSGYVECSSIEAETYGDNLAGLFFIGIFLSMLFVMATVLIMYYKQITEGHEDKERYEIMQNVGMSHREVRKSINSQVLTVFFLPLIAAGIHMAFAFPFIYRIMTMLGLVDMKLYAMCNAGCFLVFALFYAAVYMLTSRLYYRIVRK